MSMLIAHLGMKADVEILLIVIALHLKLIVLPPVLIAQLLMDLTAIKNAAKNTL